MRDSATVFNNIFLKQAYILGFVLEINQKYAAAPEIDQPLYQRRTRWGKPFQMPNLALPITPENGLEVAFRTEENSWLSISTENLPASDQRSSGWLFITRVVPSNEWRKGGDFIKDTQADLAIRSNHSIPSPPTSEIGPDRKRFP